MAIIAKVSSTSSGLNLRIEGLAKTADHYTITITCNGTTSGNLGTTTSSSSAAYNFTGLSANTSYTASASVTDNDTAANVPISSTSFTTDAVSNTPSTLTGLAVGTVTTTTIPLTWNASTPVTGYLVDWGSSSTPVGAVTSYTIGGLTNGTAYSITVTPFNGGYYGTGQTVPATTTAITPDSLTNLSAGTPTTNSVPLTWSTSTNAKSYDIVTKNSSGTQIGSTVAVTAPTTSATISGLSTYTYYSFTVTPKNGSLAGGSATANATTKDTSAGAITSVSPSNITKATIDLTWTPANPVTGYSIEYGTSTSYGTKATTDNLTTTTRISPLSAGTKYYFKVYATNRSGDGGTPAFTNATTTALVYPSDLTGLASNGQTNNSIDLIWNASTNATGYTISRSGVSDVNTGNTYYSALNLNPSTTYTFTVTPYNADGSGVGQTKSYSTTIAPPSTPTGFTATTPTTATDTTMDLSWIASAGSPSSYDVSWTNGAGSTGGGNTGGTGTTYKATGLLPKTTYTFYVNAKNSGGSSSQVSTSKATNPSVPSALSGLTATVNGSTAITLSWTASTDATNYNISWTGGSTGSTSTSLTSKQITGLLEAKSYTFTVTPTNVTGSGTSGSKSATTNDVTYPTVSTPTVSFTGVTMNVSWTANDNAGISTIRVYVDNGANSYTSKGVYPSNATNTTSSPITTDGAGSSWLNGNTYKVKVEVTDTSGLVTTSAIGSAMYTKTAPAAPATPTLSNTTYNSTSVSWGSVINADAYLMEWKKTSDSTWSSDTVTTTTQPLQGLSASTNYQVRITSLRNDDHGSYITGGTSGIAPFTTSAPPDTTPPEIMITSSNGVNIMQFGWNASDDVALMSPNPFQVFIDNVSKGFTTSTNFTFTSDANGNPFVSGNSYTLKVTAFDSSGNSSSDSRVVTYTYTNTSSRPANFAWSYPKNANSPFNVYAVEWNNLTSKINEFRNYKGLSTFTFTNATSGMTFLASIMNEASNSTVAMSPSVGTPSAKYIGDTIYATDINKLRDSLNSIT